MCEQIDGLHVITTVRTCSGVSVPNVCRRRYDPGRKSASIPGSSSPRGMCLSVAKIVVQTGTPIGDGESARAGECVSYSGVSTAIETTMRSASIKKRTRIRWLVGGRLRPIAYVWLLLLPQACERPSGLASARVTPAPTAERQLTIAEFVPVRPWPWDGETLCTHNFDLVTEAGRARRDSQSRVEIHDSSTAYVIGLVANPGYWPTAGLFLEFDRNKRLLVYSEHRGNAYKTPTEPRWGTAIHIAIHGPLGEMYARAINWWQQPRQPDERVEASADSIYHAPLLGASGRALRLALERCQVGGGFTTPFDRAK